MTTLIPRSWAVIRPLLRRAPARRGAALAAALGVAAVLTALAGMLPAAAWGKGNASAAAGFLENAQNDDGGFGTRRGRASDPTASAWVAVALLAAGRNPQDEWIKGGDSLADYLRAHSSAFSSTEQLGVIALVQGASGAGASRYGNPAAKLKRTLTASAVRTNPRGAAIAVLGLLAVGGDGTARAAAQLLLGAARRDGGWGSSDSASTALVLQALAKVGVADRGTPAVRSGLEYLKRAQANDGAIMTSIRTDPAATGGSVSATAFAIQALDALGAAPIRTPTGKTLREGLAQYQQRTTGGLSSNGSLYDTAFAPSVIETAQAYPAFNGTTFPLDQVAASTSGPPKQQASPATTPRAKQVSSGSATTGISDVSSTTAYDSGAYQGATAGQQGSATKGSTDRGNQRARGGSQSGSASGGTSVTGSVVGATSAPKLATRAGQDPGGLSDQAKAAIALGAILAALAVLGAVLDARRPPADGRSRAQVAVAGGAAVLAAARARRAFAPAAVACVGLALVAVPFVTGMWARAPQGAAMITAFEPSMREARVAAYQRDLGDLEQGIREASVRGPRALFPGLGAGAARQRFATAAPMFSGFQAQWPKTNASLRSVVDPIVQARPGYEALAALPSFRLFPWFFVVPGAALFLLGLAALVWPRAWSGVRWGVVAVGAGLVAAPIAFSLWDRAPQGAALVEAFRPVETRAKVVRVQNDFGQVAIVQGALAGELIPALQRRGLTQAEIDRQFPAVTQLNRRWIQILNDLTPVIGVMSNNVRRFQAVAELPPLTAFPWIFLIPGLLALGIVAVRSVPRRRPSAEAAVAPAAVPPAAEAPQPAQVSSA